MIPVLTVYLSHYIMLDEHNNSAKQIACNSNY